jgi:hypothetical protein
MKTTRIFLLNFKTFLIYPCSGSVLALRHWFLLLLLLLLLLFVVAVIVVLILNRVFFLPPPLRIPTSPPSAGVLCCSYLRAKCAMLVWRKLSKKSDFPRTHIANGIRHNSQSVYQWLCSGCGFGERVCVRFLQIVKLCVLLFKSVVIKRM